MNIEGPFTRCLNGEVGEVRASPPRAKFFGLGQEVLGPGEVLQVIKLPLYQGVARFHVPDIVGIGPSPRYQRMPGPVYLLKLVGEASVRLLSHRAGKLRSTVETLNFFLSQASPESLRDCPSAMPPCQSWQA